jgi:hypothetical protein
MVRTVLTAALALTTAALAHAHFVFVVPDAKNPAKVMVVFSEDLEIDEAVPAERLNGLKLTGRFEGGKEAPVECKAGKSCLTAELGLVNPQAVFGTHTLGVMQKGDAKPFLLAYHAKAVFAGADPKHALLGAKLAPAELIPEAADGKVRFRFVAGGKPVADAVVTVIKPEGGKATATHRLILGNVV